nr:DNA helicase [Tanacetum cinerariifolium]
MRTKRTLVGKSTSVGSSACSDQRTVAVRELCHNDCGVTLGPSTKRQCLRKSSSVPCYEHGTPLPEVPDVTPRVSLGDVVACDLTGNRDTDGVSVFPKRQVANVSPSTLADSVDDVVMMLYVRLLLLPLRIYGCVQFPPLFLYGEDDYSKDLKMISAAGSSSDQKRVSMKAYYSYYLHDRTNRYNYLSRIGRFFPQYIVTAFCAVEQNRIDYIREHKNDIRNEYLSGIYDAINRGDNDGSDCGRRLILPQSLIGGPRYMYSHYLDALAICRKSGLPHCHTLLWIHESERIRREEDIDMYIAAELPQHVDSECYRIVSEFMMQEPCGLAYPAAPCTHNNGKCKKGFPKEFSNQTYIEKSGFVHYKRRNTGVKTSRQDIELDNGYVVPYNKKLLT